MPAAARFGDKLSHSLAAGLGTPGGLFGMGLTILTSPGTAILYGVGIMVGEEVGIDQGQIVTGSVNVIVGSSMAARAGQDLALCDLHTSVLVAQGSTTVLVNGKMAARRKDLLACSGKISGGCNTVIIGGKTGTAVAISPEIPTWAVTAVNLIGLAAGGLLGIAAAGAWVGGGAFIGSLLGAKGGAAVGKWAGGELADLTGGDRETYERIGGKVGGFIGGIAGGEAGGLAGEGAGAAWEGTPGSAEPAPNPAEEQPGESSGPEDPSTCGDPVAVATGAMLDDAVDFALPGLIPFEWKRSYSSDRSGEVGPFGAAGWTHAYAQWIEERAAAYCLRTEGGRSIYFEKIGAGASTFHRRERLTLHRDAEGIFRVESAGTGLVRVFASDRAGRAALTAIRDGYGNTVELAYEAGRLARITDTAGRLVRILYDDRARIGRVEVWSAGAVRERWQWVQYGYGPEGELASAMDALGAVVRYAYDDLHRITRRTLPSGLSFHYTYDPVSGRCTRTVGDEGLLDSHLSFDLAAKTTLVTGADEPRRYTWTAAGVVVREETLDGAWSRSWVYDDDQNVIAETDPSGGTVRSEHDARGNLVRRADPAGNVTRWEIATDRPVKRHDPDGTVTAYAYDAAGKLVETRTPLGLTYRLTYDARGRLAAIQGDDGPLAGFAYDEQHNVVQELDARGSVTSYAYDPLGRPVMRRDALGRETRVVYDALGQPVQILLPDGTSRRMVYDAVGRVVQRVDGMGQATFLEYSGVNALTRLVQPNGQRWHFGHDALERILSITNPQQETYEYRYDGAGHVREEKSFHGRTLRYSYEGDHLSRIDYPDRTSRAFRYDPLGNLLVDEAAESSIAFERDPLGRLKAACVVEVSGKVVTSFERDPLGRVVAEAQGDHVVRYGYDGRGRLSSRVLPNGATTRYQYDVAGALAAVSHDGHEVSLDRDVLGREVRRHVRGSGVEIRSAYDAMDRLIHQEATAPRPGGYQAAAMLSQRRWRYDGAGRVAGIDDVRWGTTHYGYDRVGRLVRVARGGYREVFEYDAAGSLGGALRDLEQVGRVPAWTIKEGNVLVETHEASYDNDLQGRRTRRVDKRTGQEAQYSWDCRDQLREVRLGDGRRVRYTYDAFGRRVRKEIVGPEGRSAVDFLWDREVLAAEIGRREGPRVFVHAPGSFAPMLQQEQGGVFTYVNDHHGMPRELIGEDGRVAWSAAQSAWGEVVEVWRDPGAGRAVETPFRMLGQYLDEETGLCYTRFRYFDAGVGRWISPDPLGVEGGANLLAFDGSPTNDVDPLGLACVPQRAQDTASHADATGGASRPGYKGNSPFANDGRGGGQVLPRTDAGGAPITYKEYDVNPYTPGVNRGTERVVRGSDGSNYYTSDHYSTFSQF